jgi:hypothetical protein
MHWNFGLDREIYTIGAQNWLGESITSQRFVFPITLSNGNRIMHQRGTQVWAPPSSKYNSTYLHNLNPGKVRADLGLFLSEGINRVG